MTRGTPGKVHFAAARSVQLAPRRVRTGSGDAIRCTGTAEAAKGPLPGIPGPLNSLQPARSNSLLRPFVPPRGSRTVAQRPQKLDRGTSQAFQGP